MTTIFSRHCHNATWDVFILKCILYFIKNNQLHLNHTDVYHMLKKGSAHGNVEEITLFLFTERGCEVFLLHKKNL